METRRTASLIPDIASARRFEFARVVKDLVDQGVFSYPAGFEQKPLLLTAYGRRLVEETGVTEFKYLAPHLQELGREIGVDVPEFIPLGDSKPYVIGAKTPERPKPWQPGVSERLARVMLMFTDIMDPPSINDIYTLFESGFASSADVVTLVIEDRQDAWTQGLGYMAYYDEMSMDRIYLAAVEHLASLSFSQHRTSLLSKVLVKRLPYHYERRNYASEVQLAAIRGLRKDKANRATKAVLEFVKRQEWEPFGESCKDRHAVLLYTTSDVLDESLGFLIERGQDIQELLTSFMDCLNWSSEGGIGEVITRRLVETSGVEAFEALISHLRWERMGCGSGVSDNVSNALTTLGTEILPKLQNYLWDNGSINRTVVAIMERIEISSKPLMEFLVQNARSISAHDTEWLFKTIRNGDSLLP
ncbi:MAG: hypothetical protein ACE5H4_12805 [Candidatus Thorarchaeota archaeon]